MKVSSGRVWVSWLYGRGEAPLGVNIELRGPRGEFASLCRFIEKSMEMSSNKGREGREKWFWQACQQKSSDTVFM